MPNQEEILADQKGAENSERDGPDITGTKIGNPHGNVVIAGLGIVAPDPPLWGSHRLNSGIISLAINSIVFLMTSTSRDIVATRICCTPASR